MYSLYMCDHVKNHVYLGGKVVFMFTVECLVFIYGVIPVVVLTE